MPDDEQIRIAVLSEVSSELAQRSLRGSTQRSRSRSEKDTAVEGHADSLTIIDGFDLGVLHRLFQLLLLLVHLLADERTSRTTDDTTDSSTDSGVTQDTADTCADGSTTDSPDTCALHGVAQTTARQDKRTSQESCYKRLLLHNSFS